MNIFPIFVPFFPQLGREFHYHEYLLLFCNPSRVIPSTKNSGFFHLRYFFPFLPPTSPSGSLSPGIIISLEFPSDNSGINGVLAPSFLFFLSDDQRKWKLSNSISSPPGFHLLNPFDEACQVNPLSLPSPSLPSFPPCSCSSISSSHYTCLVYT